MHDQYWRRFVHNALTFVRREEHHLFVLGQNTCSAQAESAKDYKRKSPFQSSRSAGPGLVHYAFALFVMAPLSGMRIVGHFAPSLIRSILVERLLTLSLSPNEPSDRGNRNKSDACDDLPHVLPNILTVLLCEPRVKQTKPTSALADFCREDENSIGQQPNSCNLSHGI